MTRAESEVKLKREKEREGENVCSVKIRRQNIKRNVDVSHFFIVRMWYVVCGVCFAVLYPKSDYSVFDTLTQDSSETYTHI